MASETLVIGLKAFFQLYEMGVTYSLGMSNRKSEIIKKSAVKEEKKDLISSSMREKSTNHFNLPEEDIKSRKRSNSLKGDEENLCSICFEKQIQIILPCTVTFLISSFLIV